MMVWHGVFKFNACFARTPAYATAQHARARRSDNTVVFTFMPVMINDGPLVLHFQHPVQSGWCSLAWIRLNFDVK